jgi:hypothetical protein
MAFEELIIQYRQIIQRDIDTFFRLRRRLMRNPKLCIIANYMTLFCDLSPNDNESRDRLHIFSSHNRVLSYNRTKRMLEYFLSLLSVATHPINIIELDNMLVWCKIEWMLLLEIRE